MRDEKNPNIDKLSQLTEEQGQLLKKALLNRQSGEQKAQNQAIKTVTKSSKNQKSSLVEYANQRQREKYLPVSFSQERIWFLNQLEGNTSVYNMDSVVKLTGKLNINALEKAIQYLCSRHESLRSNFYSQEGKVFLKINPVDDYQLKVTGLDKNLKIRNFVSEKTKEVFDLEKGQLVRFYLIKRTTEEYIFIISIHHIISDGWSMDILNKELSHLYQSYCQDITPTLPELSIQYVDFAAWQKEYLQGNVLEEKIKYWREELKDAPTTSTFPIDCPRGDNQSFKGGMHTVRLGKTHLNQLQNLSIKEGGSLFITLLTAFKILLYRHTLQEQLIIGFPDAGRNNLAIENLIGFFVDTLLVSSKFEGNSSFISLLHQVKDSIFKTYENQELPFEKLVAEIQPERKLNHNPLFQVWFNMFNIKRQSLELNNLKVEPWSENDDSENISEIESKFDVTIYLQNSEDGLQIKWVYNQNLYKPDTIKAFASHYKAILKGVVAEPEQQINDLPRPVLPAIFPNPGEVLAIPVYELVTSKIAKWVEKSPQQIAITQNNQSWSYQQLWQKSQCVAQLLNEQGISQGDVVGISGEKSFDLIVAIIGVLLSGGTMLTIDSALPLARRKLMLSETKAQLLLFVETNAATSSPEDPLLEEISIPHIMLDVENRFPDDTDVTIIELPQLNPAEQAYIFFTSGTASIPKAVSGCHQGLAHFIDWEQNTFSVEPGDNVAQLTSLSFDVFLRDIFLPLGSGATLCLPHADLGLDGQSILSWLETEKITILHSVPSLVQSWLFDVNPDITLADLRWLFLAGEILNDTLVNEWRKLFPLAKNIANFYGPTEATLAKFYYIIPDEVSVGVQPVGYPLPDTQGLVVSDNQTQCYIKEAGEILIRTPFRTLGYINNTSETELKFVNNLHSNQKNDLLYHTGDLGRYRSDGCLEIIGRVDNQVKIRGIRVEPEEISSVLNQHPLIKKSIVVAQEKTDGNKHLIAYVITDTKQPAFADLRQFLTLKLPEQMIPTAFVFLDKFPLTANGKLDRKALPEPDLESNRADEFIAPESETEIKLTKIWQEVLGTKQIGIHDNFFHLGGHSLLAVQLFSKISDTFGKQLHIAILFTHPTVHDIAELIVSDLPDEGYKDITILKEGDNKKPPLFCLYGILLFKALADSLDTDRRVCGVYLEEEIAIITKGVDSEEFKAFSSIDNIVKLYIERILAYQPEGPYYLCSASFGGIVALEVARKLEQQGEQVNLIAMFDTFAPGYNYKLSLLKRMLIHIQEIQQSGFSYIKEKISKKIQINSAPTEIDMHDELKDLRRMVRSIAKQNYQPEKYFGKVCLFRAQEGSVFGESQEDLGWGHYIEKLDIFNICGDHLGILTKGNVEQLTDLLLEKMQ